MSNHLLKSKITFLNKNNAIIAINNELLFYSYESFICIYNQNDYTLSLNNSLWDYSNTTRKYFKYFINNYTCFNYISKNKFIDLIADSKDINILTNNIKEVS